MADSTIPGLADATAITSAYSIPMSNGAGGDEEVPVNLLKPFIGTALKSFFVPARAAYPAQTAGCAAHSVVTGAAGQPDFWGFDFADGSKLHAQFAVQMPKNWDEGTIQAAMLWRHPATTTNFGVRWGLAAVAVSDDDTLAVNFGTAQEVTDTGGTTNDVYFTAKTPAITIAGTPQPEDLVFFDVYRDPANAADTLAVAATLLGVKVYYSTNTTDEA